ncbi:hypothetical protein ACOMHN_061756 [Nucella lapillus]
MDNLLAILTPTFPLLLLSLLLLTHHLHPFSQAQAINNNNNSSSSDSRRLVRAGHCPDMVMGEGGRYWSGRARSVLECLARCGPDGRCLAIVFHGVTHECHHCNDTARLDCSNMVQGAAGMKYYETKVICEKTEEQPGPGGVCVCADGYRGNPCKPYIGDCSEGYSTGQFTENKVYRIQPRLSAGSFLARCKNMTNKRTYIMERSANTLNFNTTYADYVAGFGNPAGDHWLGLDRVYELTNSKTYELRIFCKLQNKSLSFMQYQQFNISSKEDGYRLWFNLTFADTYLLGDCFTPLWKSQFSAMDHDKDEDDTVNCAAKHGGGWWFRGKNCSTCNPTGPLLKPNNGKKSGVDAEAFWTQNLGDSVPFKIAMFLVSED